MSYYDTNLGAGSEFFDERHILQSSRYETQSNLPISPPRPNVPIFTPPRPESSAEQYIRSLVKKMGRHIDDALVQENGLVELYHFGEKKENSRKLLDLGAGEAVVKAMKHHKNNQRVCTAGCAVVRNISGNLYKFYQKGIGVVVLSCMNVFPHDDRLQSSACYAIRTLARCTANAEQMVKFGVGKLIAVAMETHRENEDVQKAACGAIWCLCGSSSSTDQLWDHNLPFLVVQAMLYKPMSAKVQEYGSGALRHFNRPYSVVRMGGGKVILHAMAAHKRNERLVSYCLKALRDFSLLRSNAEALLARNCTASIITCLEYHKNNKTIQIDGCGAIWNLSQWQDGRQMFVDDKVGRVLVHIVKQFSGNGSNRPGSVKLVGAALLLLTRFGKQEAAVRDFLTRNICREVSCSALKFMSVPQGEEVVAKSLDLLIQFSATVPENKQLILAEAEVLLQNIENNSYGDSTVAHKADQLSSLLLS